MKTATFVSLESLNALCINTNHVHYQLSSDLLVQQTIARGQGRLCNTGALTIKTGKFTGRSPKDKYIVFDENIKEHIDWNEFNNPIDNRYFDYMLDQAVSFLNSQQEIFVRDAYACSSLQHRLHLRIVNQLPAMNLFAGNMLFGYGDDTLPPPNPDWHIISAPGLELDTIKSGTRQCNATVINFSKKIILIIGSGYTGEIKKSIFTILNYLLPTHENVLSMHCAANEGADGTTALFFGLSGTGKTTLSTDASRRLIGDDEHGWDDTGIFNFEGGCYAKCIGLSAQKEPEIFNAIRSGALVENVGFIQGTNCINFDDASITENTRVSYPLSFISNRVPTASGATPSDIIFLSCDAFGVLPPVSRLTTEQAIYYFLNGYTARIAGTEEGVSAPKPTFSTCFGAPFMPLHPMVYAGMLKEKIVKHDVRVWMVNTGWSGGSYGEGQRIALPVSRAIVNAILNLKLEEVPYITEPIFGLHVPAVCPGIADADILQPRNTWQDKAAYDRQARQLLNYFINNYSRFLEGEELLPHSNTGNS